MKSLHQSSSESSFRRPIKFKTMLDKQNLPNNQTKQPNEGSSQITTRKVGLEIKNRIQKGYNNISGKPLCQSAILNLPSLSLRESESLFSQGQTKGKNVSFDQSDRQPSALLRHNSRKSILKNSLSNSKRSCSLQRSQISLANSHVDYQDQSVDFSVGNKTLMQKYKSLRNNCIRKGEKYRDEIYPPVKNSIYLNNSLMKNFLEMFEKEGRSIEWMRISQLYKNEQLVVWSSQKSQKSHIIKGYISKTSGDSDFLTTVFNAISEKNNLLEKMFESQEVNSQGIYYVKIHQTQTNIWKYVIIDDYIPVIVNTKLEMKERYLSKNVHPAFLNVYGLSNKLQIWPFLLQKALAKYYSTYDSLANGNTLDFLEEVASVFLQNIKIKDNLDKVRSLLQNSDTLMLGEDKKGVLHPFKTMNLQSEIKTFIYLDREDNFIEKGLQRQEFLNKFTVLHYAQLHKYYYTNKCQIQQQNLRNRVNSQKQPYILRQFLVEQNCQCQIGTIQKQQRFYRSYLTYEYVWMRLILVEKQAKGYRWIGGAYSNSKSTKLTAVLTPGEYVVIMIPEWRQKAYDFNLIFHGNVQTLFERKKYELYADIIQQSCMDLAQRFGKLVQVNKNICSYHFIEKTVGFIIENVNNQKQNGHVRILRSVEGLQNYNIRPINPEFANKTNVEIMIPKSGHFTVVLMTSKGVERAFLDSFDFGF